MKILYWIIGGGIVAFLAYMLTRKTAAPIAQVKTTPAAANANTASLPSAFSSALSTLGTQGAIAGASSLQGTLINPLTGYLGSWNGNAAAAGSPVITADDYDPFATISA